MAQDTQNAKKDSAKRGPFVERALRRLSTTSEFVIEEPDLKNKMILKSHLSTQNLQIKLKLN